MQVISIVKVCKFVQFLIMHMTLSIHLYRKMFMFIYPYRMLPTISASCRALARAMRLWALVGQDERTTHAGRTGRIGRIGTSGVGVNSPGLWK